jgi:hypothetical protein
LEHQSVDVRPTIIGIGLQVSILQGTYELVSSMLHLFTLDLIQNLSHNSLII